MALALAIREHFSIDVSYTELARLVRRGGTSGIGVHISDAGGVVVDAGHSFPDEKLTFLPSSKSLAPPPLLVEAQSAPEGCQIVHVRLEARGISGDLERDFFSKHCPIPEQETQRLLEIVDQHLLPGIRCRSLSEINRSLASIQNLGLKAREWSIQGSSTATLRKKWQSLKFSTDLPLCLSSMGPTVFVLTDNPDFVYHQLLSLDVPEQSISVTNPWSGGYLVEHERLWSGRSARGIQWNAAHLCQMIHGSVHESPKSHVMEHLTPSPYRGNDSWSSTGKLVACSIISSA
jgi:beta-ribofuranosylaminobenzene 5'-phosphate synthase